MRNKVIAAGAASAASAAERDAAAALDEPRVTYDDLKAWAQALLVNISDIQVEDMWQEAGMQAVLRGFTLSLSLSRSLARSLALALFLAFSFSLSLSL
jgi:hypothetical protein